MYNFQNTWKEKDHKLSIQYDLHLFYVISWSSKLLWSEWLILIVMIIDTIDETQK